MGERRGREKTDEVVKEGETGDRRVFSKGHFRKERKEGKDGEEIQDWHKKRKK